MGAILPEDFYYARICFVVAAIILGIPTFIWALVDNKHSKSFCILSVIVVALLIGFGLPTALDWVSKRESAITRLTNQPSSEVTQKPSPIETPKKPIPKIPEKKEMGKPKEIVKPLEEREGKEIDSRIKPKLSIDISALQPQENLQRYQIHINNHNRQSASITDFRMEFRFKGYLVEMEQWPGLMTGNIAMGRLENRRNLALPQIIRPLIPENCSFNIRQDEIGGQMVNSNILVFNCMRWPRNVGFFSAVILIESVKKPRITIGRKGTYVGTYYYEVEGQVLSETLSGLIKDANDKH